MNIFITKLLRPLCLLAAFLYPYWSAHAEIRLVPKGSFFTRWDFSKNKSDFNAETPDTINFFRSRFRADLRLIVSERMSFFFQPQLSHNWGSTAMAVDPTPGIHQLFLEYKADPLVLRVGRQELNYGHGLILSHNPWDLIGNAFDGLRARILHGNGHTDLIWAKVTETGIGTGGGGDDDLYGINTHFSFGKAMDHFDLYAIHFSNQASSPRESSTSIGLVTSTQNWSGFGYSLEPVFQNARASAQSLVDLELSYRLMGSFQNQFGFGFLHVSDNFQPLYPDIHRHLGSGDLFGLRNMMAFRFFSDTEISQNTGFRIDYHLFSRASDSTPAFKTDGLTGYGFNGTDKSIAQELDLTFHADFDSNLSLEIIAAFVFSGPYLKANLGSSGAQVLAVYLDARF